MSDGDKDDGKTAHNRFVADKLIYDEDGCSLKVGLLNGKLVPPFGQQSLRSVKNLAIRDDDIILIGYPKTGCHWTWEILRMIVNGNTKYSDDGKSVCFLELVSDQMSEESQGRGRVLNTHLWWDEIPKQIIEKKTKIVFTVRNPKDTAVSYYNHYKSLVDIYEYRGSFESWFKLFMSQQVDYGSYFDYHQQWDRDIKNNPDHPIHIVYFEDMKQDLPRELRRLCHFLEVKLSDNQIEDIAKAAGFVKMKEAYYAENKTSKELLRKGEVGDWQNWLSASQIEALDQAAKEKLAGTIFSRQIYKL